MTLTLSTGPILQGKRSTFRLKLVWQGASCPAPGTCPKDDASIRLRQSPLRRDQISLKLSSASWRSPARRIDPCASIVDDVEIASWLPRVFGRGRGNGRAAMRIHAPSFDRLA